MNVWQILQNDAFRITHALLIWSAPLTTIVRSFCSRVSSRAALFVLPKQRSTFVDIRGNLPRPG